MRSTLALALALVGYFGVSRTLAYTLRSRQPEWAYALEPGDGRVSALLARKLSGPEATSADRVRSDALARRALLQDPTAVVAVSTLGLNTQLRGNASGARRLFVYAQRLSRRDLATQLWAIEDAVARGDVNEALRHYDMALRTSYAAPDLLFPVLSAAIADPMVRAGAARLLVTRPGWGDSFLLYAAARGPDPRATADLLTDLHRLGLHVSQAATTELIKVLISAKFMDDAWQYYADINPDAERRSSRDPAFTADFVNPSPFDWVPVNEGGVTTSIQRSEHGGLFDFAAPASIGGPLLRQVQVLPPGRYRIEGHSSNIEQPTGSTPYWVLTCTDGRELGRVAIPASGQTKSRFVGQFDVPADCPAQTLTLIARPSDMVEGVNGQIDRVRLFPAP